MPKGNPPEDHILESTNVMRDNFYTRKRRWSTYAITAPGYHVMSPVMVSLGGLLGGIWAVLGLMLTGKLITGLWSVLVVAAGVLLGRGYAKLVNRTVGNESLIRKGKAVILQNRKRNRMVVEAAKRDAPGYFHAALRAAELDKIEERLEKTGLSKAERTVYKQEMSEGTAELKLMLSQASLVHAAALLDPSDPAIRAAGHVTAAMYAELQEGKAASYKEDH